MESDTTQNQQQKEQPNDNVVLYKRIETAIDEFMKEVRSSDPSWEKISSDDTVTFWKQKGTDDANGIFKIKFVGRVKHPVDIVCRALFDYRKVWDKVIDQVNEIETLDNKDKSKIIHIVSRSPFPLAVAHRDFVHVRTTRVEKDYKIVLDVSTTHPKCPEKTGFVRAHTFVSGGLFEASFIPNIQTKKLEEGTVYSCITQVDFKGYVPVWVVNMIAAKSTIDWFYTLRQACDQLAAGELKLQ